MKRLGKTVQKKLQLGVVIQLSGLIWFLIFRGAIRPNYSLWSRLTKAYHFKFLTHGTGHAIRIEGGYFEIRDWFYGNWSTMKYHFFFFFFLNPGYPFLFSVFFAIKRPTPFWTELITSREMLLLFIFPEFHRDIWKKTFRYFKPVFSWLLVHTCMLVHVGSNS